MLLLTREGWAGVDRRSEFSGEHLLDRHGCDDVLRLHIGQLNPIADELVSNPEHCSVTAGTALLLKLALQWLILTVQSALSNPVIGTGAEDLTKELERFGASDLGQPPK
jgi:hypothetical protein